MNNKHLRYSRIINVLLKNKTSDELTQIIENTTDEGKKYFWQGAIVRRNCRRTIRLRNME